MKNYQFSLIISNIYLGLSFLSKGIDRADLIFLGVIWFINAIITGEIEK